MHTKDMVAIAKHALEVGHTNYTREDMNAAIAKRAAEIGRQWAWVAEYDSVGQLLMKAQRFAADSPVKDSYLDGREPNVATLEPRVVSGPEAFRVNDPKDALSELERLVDEQVTRDPTRSRAQHFADQYSKRPDLAAQERTQNRPVAPMAKTEHEATVRPAKPARYQEDGDGSDGDGDALEQLNRKTKEHLRKNPHLSFAQAFARVFQDNGQLAEAERQANRPVPTAHSKYEKRGAGY